MRLNRRKFLGGLALAPVTGRAAMQQAAAQLSGSAAALAGGGLDSMAVGVSDSSPAKFTEFVKYALKRESEWRRQAKHVTHLDPDLLGMHLPLSTLFAWQSKRNYERIKADEEFNFKNIVSKHGEFQWWG